MFSVRIHGLILGIGQVLYAFQIFAKRFSRNEVLMISVRGVIFCCGSKGPDDLFTLIC